MQGHMNAKFVQYIFGVADFFVKPVIPLEFVKLACGSSELGS